MLSKEKVTNLEYNSFVDVINKDILDYTYLFIGEEEYLMNECIEFLKRRFVDESLEALNYSILEGKTITFDDLINTCETLPFMSSKKIVLLKDITYFLEREEKNIDKELYNYLDNLGNHLCLIIEDNTNEVKKNTKLYKYFNKNSRVIEFNKLKGKELTQWISKIAKKHNVNISYSNVNYFIQQSTYLSRNIASNLYDLENELIKVISYSKSSEISKEDIDSVIIKSLDNNIFDLLASINRGDIDSSLSIFNDIYVSNEPVPKILFMISRQIRLMLGYIIYRNKGYADGEIIEKLQIKNYEYSKISSQARLFTIKDLEDKLNLILRVDKKLKTSGTDDKIEMEILIIKLSQKI